MYQTGLENFPLFMYLLFGAPLLSGLLGWVLGKWTWGQVLATLVPIGVLVASIFMPFGDEAFVALPLGDGPLGIDFAMQMAPGLWEICCVILTVAGAAGLFSVGYIRGNWLRYHLLFCLFTLGMLTLTLAGNFIALLLGWEVMGLASYALISTYYSRKEVGENAFIVFMVNRVGDMALLAAIGIWWAQTGTFDFPPSIWVPALARPNVAFWCCVGLAAMVKSGQWPFAFWLRKAMVGPGNVSAMLHAATLVVAGVVLLLKLQAAIPPDVALIFGNIFLASAIICAIRAFFADDFKALLACSTSAQMGLLLASAATTNQSYAIDHIASHAFFKAELFLLVSLLGSYAIPNGAISLPKLPKPIGREWLVVAAVVLSVMGLLGVPYTQGGLSKEHIMEGLTKLEDPLILWMFGIYTVFSIAYVLRLVHGFLLVWQRVRIETAFAAFASRPQYWAIGALLVAQLLWAVDALENRPEFSMLSLGVGLGSVLLFAGGLALFLKRERAIISPIPELPAFDLQKGIDAIAYAPIALETRLAALPLLTARAVVVLSYGVYIAEKAGVWLAATAFKLVLAPVRMLTFSLGTFGVGRAIFWSVLLFAALMYVLLRQVGG